MHIPRPFVVVGLLAAVSLVALAGPLNPPSGPISPTYKTLSEVQPRQIIQTLPGSATAQFVISQPGSYYLTAPIVGIAGKSGIEIAASDVTLDLCGFPMTGAAGSAEAIRVAGDRSSIRVEHGAIRGWSGIGVNLSTCRAGLIRDITVSNCDTGILSGAAAIVQGCTTEFNRFNGTSAGEGSRLQNCNSNWNSALGFYISEGASAEHCTAAHNTTHGYYLDGDGCTVLHSTARSNGGSGIMSIYTCTVDSCTAEINAVAGITAAAGSVVRSSIAQSNDRGGIAAGAGVAVVGCTARANTLFGISITDGGRVENNVCADNHAFGKGSGAGILATGSGSRIDANSLTGNDVGLLITVPGNFVTRNSASANPTNYNLIAGQSAGPIISGPANLNAASPWANLEF